MTVESAGGRPGERPAWPAKPIRGMTVEELRAVIRYLEAAVAVDEALVRALHAELTLRQRESD